ncbi:hypothetical protein [Flavobacterium facile]|uniref:hypothetical protein n=1 Tax=Flavobacterium facile TaxID=2893174 RepID=UPI002E78A389|nr:hypothetical protein [Flavobacterium sp. T-12]
MSTNSQEQEIDLSQIGKSISKVFQNAINMCFDFLFFIQKRIIIIASLFVIGVIAGYLIDKGRKYEHKISVIPNFGSSDYLYNQIDLLQKKLDEKDDAFFKKIGINDSRDILSFKIEANQVVYSFISDRERGVQNLELIKLMAEDGDIDKILKDKLTSRNYYLHTISIVTKGQTEESKLVKPLLNYLEKSEYFLKQKNVNQKNVKEKIVFNELLIKQIDSILSNLQTNKGASSITISEKSSISDLIEKKDHLIQENQYLNSNNIIYDKIIKEESTNLNNWEKAPLFLNLKVLLPLLLIFIYLFGVKFNTIYQQQKKRIQS